MKIGSLFSGIGGLELGLERAIPGAHTVFQVEQDSYARRVLAKHWPNARRYEDVRQVGAHNLPACDLLCGGYPCTGHSVAGKRHGFDDPRSGLWTEYARIIGELTPLGLRFVVVENVAALRIRGMGRVLGDLAACGYDAIWDCIPAAAVGAPHRRDRLFIVAWLAHPDSQQQHINNNGCSGTRGSKAPPAREIHLGHKSLGGRTEALAHPNRSRLQGRFSEVLRECTVQRTARQGDTCEGEPPDHRFTQCGLGRAPDGLPSGMDGPWDGPWERGIARTTTGQTHRVQRLRCLGNAVVPQVAEVVGRVVLQLAGGAP